MQKWQQTITSKEIEFKAHIYGVNEIFGLQEILEQYRRQGDDRDVFQFVPRQFRVRAIGNVQLVCMRNSQIKLCKRPLNLRLV